jgi:hypothetical protein
MAQRSRNKTSHSVWWVLAAVAAVICVLLPIHFWLRLLFAELILMVVAVELLTHYIPSHLLSASQANCYRLDGSSSPRRQSRERRAVRQVRSDLWAVFLVVGFGATGSLAAIHEFVFPFPLVSEVMAAATDPSPDFKTALRDRSVDSQFFQWARSSSRRPNSQINQHMDLLWLTWPVLGFLAIVGLAGCVVAIRYTYLRSLSEFRAGVANRANEYLNLDTARLQDS